MMAIALLVWPSITVENLLIKYQKFVPSNFCVHLAAPHKWLMIIVFDDVRVKSSLWCILAIKPLRCPLLCICVNYLTDLLLCYASYSLLPAF